MQIVQKNIKGLIEMIPKVFEDDRGWFFESYNKKLFKEHNIDVDFVQDNISFSKKGVLRGLHFQFAPYAQGKLVRVITGKALDVAVDIRPDSPTFGKYESVLLDSKLKNMFWIPPGFAHGFLALEECVFSYKCTNIYHKASESGIIWNDATLNINWGIADPVLSDKDIELLSFEELKNKLEIGIK